MHYVIIGANAAGLSAAVRIKKSEPTAKITVIEKSDVVSFGACGLPYFVGGAFSDVERMTARPLEAFLKQGIDIKTHHQAIKLDPKNRSIDIINDAQEGFSLSYDKLLITTGATPVTPPIQGINHPRVMRLHSRHDGLAIKAALSHVQQVVVIGAGFIGLEITEALVHQGKAVTLIEAADRVLSRAVDSEISELMHTTLCERGVKLLLGDSVTAIEADAYGNLKHVVSQQGVHSAQLVILATGFRPNTEFLRATDLAMLNNGAIIIDEQGKTNLDNIFAAGDCATVPHRLLGNRYIPLATTANKLGRLVGDVMSGQARHFIGTLGSSGVRVFDLEVGRTGMSEQDAKQHCPHYGTVWIKDNNHTDYVPEQSPIWVKLIYDKQSRCLLGGQIAGRYLGGAVHRVDALAVAIYSGLTVEELGFMDFIYAPPFARTWDVLNVAGNVAK